MQPPQNPYGQNPNPYGQPQQPYQQPYAPGPQAPRGTVSLDVIGEAWNLVKSQLVPWIISLLLVGALVFVAGLILGLLQLPFAPHNGSRPGGMYYIMSLITQIINAGIGGVAAAAIYRMAITQIRTGQANIGDVLSATDVLASAFVAGILVYLATFVGFLLCIIPGIIAGLGLAMTQMVITDQRLQAMDAMKASWGAMKSNLGMYFVLGLVLLLINMVGALLCGLGLLVTIPVSIMANALVYRDLFGGSGAPTQTGGYTPPPIANPNF